ncbi:uncharacterized protein N7515_006896 [Penicillium bovifimosum]|uniref:Uncharacterized protein n=1 Tax=Penicillium bovifimosum TaxID=126998 RepID=A0A9W9GVJ5_9EURO|nr:uncharacterized protein N7515_006896 [Penicillium bovifimosum]KAJ5130857.1 hypothetical protein N7515_006896 [Penicillium bovifimosum]
MIRQLNRIPWKGKCTDGVIVFPAKSTPDGGASITNTFFNGSKALYCCGTPVALGSSLRCPAHSDNGGEPFEVANGKVITGRGLLENFTPLTNTSSSIGNSTSNGTVTEKPKCNSCHETAIGAGVGVPLGCLALLFLVWALLERRRTARLRRALSTPTVTTALASRQAGPSELSDPSSKGQPVVELEGARPELDGGGPIRV